MNTVQSKYRNPDKLIEKLRRRLKERGELVSRWSWCNDADNLIAESDILGVFRVGDTVLIEGRVVEVHESADSNRKIESEIRYKCVETRRVEKP